jgi:hypothetical protein
MVMFTNFKSACQKIMFYKTNGGGEYQRAEGAEP